MRALIIASCALLLASSAHAQTTRRPPPLTGNPVNDLNNAIKGQAAQSATSAGTAIENLLAKPFTDLANFIGDDSTQAIALATAVPELQDGHGQQCWMAMKQFGEVAKAHPIPVTLKVQTDVEAFRLLLMAANNLCANPHCTQVFADMANAVQTMAPLNASIPVPSLNGICAKVPQIAVVAPIAVSAATPAAPAAAPAATTQAPASTPAPAPAQP